MTKNNLINHPTPTKNNNPRNVQHLHQTFPYEYLMDFNIRLIFTARYGSMRHSIDSWEGDEMRILFLVAFLTVSPVATAQNVYFSNLHAHTSHSDGRGTPDDAYTSARAAGLDFFAVTKHNHDRGDGTGDARDSLLIATIPWLYAGMPTSNREAALRHTQDGVFVALYGQEFSTISSGNHINVFEIPTVLDVPAGDFPALVSAVLTAPMRRGSRRFSSSIIPATGRAAAVIMAATTI